jgi:hypothetical protein
MKANNRIKAGLLLTVVVILVGATLLWKLAEEIPGGATNPRVYSPREVASLSLESSIHENGKPSGIAAENSDHLADPLQVRGSGYMWGTALKNVFAGASLAADGTTNLNLSELEKSFKGHAAPIDLASATASPVLRAEYLSATITTALDIGASHQPILAAILEKFYAADAAVSDPGDDARNDRRAKLAGQARDTIVDAIPAEAREQFREIFRSPMFLFETRSVAAENIQYDRGEITMSATGNAVYTIGNDGSVSFTADSTTTVQAQRKPKGQAGN